MRCAQAQNKIILNKYSNKVNTKLNFLSNPLKTHKTRTVYDKGSETSTKKEQIR